MANVIYKVGTKAQFDALEQKDTNTLYWLEDVQELYKGNLLFATGTTASQTAAGLMSAEDKARLDNLVAGTVAGLTPVDASVVLADGGDGTTTIGVQLSQVEGNALKLETDGLYVGGDGAEYTIEKLDESAEGYSATYRLKKTVGDNESYVGAEINVPKDLVVQSGSVNTVTEVDQPYSGAAVGDTYIELVLNDADASHIYIPAKGLIDTSKYVVGTVDGANGTAMIFNESSGGGAMFKHTDGSQAYVGVDEGGLTGMMAQIYADKYVDGKWVGSRINVYHDHIYYTSLADKEAGLANNASECEIATKGDIAAVEEAVSALSDSIVWGSL